MNKFYEVKASYRKMFENGEQKTVTESYLFEALSCTEAEARAIKEVGSYYPDVAISSIKCAKFSELFMCYENDADKFFKVKLIFITLDEKSGAEKKTATQVLVQAADLRDAIKKLDEGMKGTMADYQIGMVSETAIMDVFKYESKND